MREASATLTRDLFVDLGEAATINLPPKLQCPQCGSDQIMSGFRFRYTDDGTVPDRQALDAVEIRDRSCSGCGHQGEPETFEVPRMESHVRIDGHDHALVYGGVDPAEAVPLDWSYFATETFPC